MLLKILKAVRAAIDQIEKRPWIPMAIYLGTFALILAVAGLLLANLIDSRWRPLPNLSSDAKVIIGKLCDGILWALVAIGMFSVVFVPAVMACALRFRAAFNTLVLGISGIGASVAFMVAMAPLFFMLGIEVDNARQESGIKNELVEVYKDYAAVASSSRELAEIVPPGATDITVVRQVYFQGHSNDFRCSISNEDLMKFAAKRKYVFKEYDLEDFTPGNNFRMYNEDDTLFSQFPKVRNGKVVGHHSDGYFTCIAIDGLNGGRRSEEHLLYIYDAKCSVLWAQCSK